MNIIDFLSLPLSLPINPIWDLIICAIIGEVAYRFAFAKAGELSYSSGERSILHWLIRVPVYFILWSIACATILIVQFVESYWLIILIVIGIIALIAIACVVIRIYVKRKKNQQKGNDEEV